MLVAPAVGFVLFYVFTVCGVPVRWPYYEPVIPGAIIEDPGAHPFLPRANLSPRATLQLPDGVSLRTRLGCYPLQSDGTQGCNLQVRLFNPNDAVISFAQQPVSVKGADGEELIDRDFYVRFADRLKDHDRPEIRNDEVFVPFGDIGLILRNVALPERFTATVPDLIINSVPVPLPAIEFVRHDNVTCTGIITNY